MWQPADVGKRVDRWEAPCAHLEAPVWSRQPVEGSKAYRAFLAYLDQQLEWGERRSLARTAEELGKSATLLKRWSHRWRWQERVKAWDRHEEALRKLAYRQSVLREEEAHRQRQQEAEQLERTLETLEHMDDDVLDLDKLPERLGALMHVALTL